MNVTAVVLSREPRETDLPGLQTINHVSSFADSRELLNARLAAMHKVATPHFFFLDDDDYLPDDYLDVVSECVDQKVAVAYTDEIIVDDGMPFLRKSAPYSESLFVDNCTLIHHLAVCDTKAAHLAATQIPLGLYMFECMFYFQLAKQGTAYVPRVGYHWVRGPQGLSRDPDILVGVVQSQIWAHRNRGAA